VSVSVPVSASVPASVLCERKCQRA